MDHGDFNNHLALTITYKNLLNLQGGGHSVLSPVFGLGVDRVLQFRLITPDGEIRIANECQNADLFWALRGGGGGTFGVVLEVTYKAERRLPLQV